MGSIVFRGNPKITVTPGSGVGDPLLTLNSSTNTVNEIPAIDTTTFISNTLVNGNILIGNGSNLAANYPVTGMVTMSNTGVTTITNGIITTTQISPTAGILYTQLTLTNTILNADINTSAAITRTKLALGTAYRIIVNDVSGILSEQATITPNVAIISDANGMPIASSLTTTVIGYIDPTSSIQTQLNNRLSFAASITPAPGDLITYSSGVWNRVALGTAGQYLVVNGGATGVQWTTVPNGVPTGGTAGQVLNKINATNFNSQWSTLTTASITDITATAAQINVLNTGFYDATSSVQGQLSSKLDKSLQTNYIFVGNTSNFAVGLAPGANGYILTSVGGVPTWVAPTSGGTVTSVAFSGGSTGLTVSGSPITSSGTITLSGTLITANGGTGFSSYTIGDLIQATTSSTFSKLNSVATGNVLISGGVATVSSWGKVGLATHVSGTLPIANGGTNITTYTTGDILYASASNVLSKLAIGTNTYVLTVTGGVPVWAVPSGGISGLTTNRIPYAQSSTVLQDTSFLQWTSTVYSGGSYSYSFLNTQASDASNSAVSYALSVSHSASSPAAIGMGVGIQFETNINNGTHGYLIGSTIESISTNVTGSSERFDISFQTYNTALTERFRITGQGNVYAGSGTTGMANGFFYIAAAAGIPSGTPTSISGRVPMYYDSTNNNFYIYNGAWKKVTLT